jgi:hypothetical protein
MPTTRPVTSVDGVYQDECAVDRLVHFGDLRVYVKLTALIAVFQSIRGKCPAGCQDIAIAVNAGDKLLRDTSRLPTSQIARSDRPARGRPSHCRRVAQPAILQGRLARRFPLILLTMRILLNNIGAGLSPIQRLVSL